MTRRGQDEVVERGGPPAVSVIVATYNRAASVARLLEQLAGQTLPAERFEVVVVDDGSVPPVAPVLRRRCYPYALTILERQNGGPGAARHHAIARARGDIVVVVDDDMCVAPEFLAEHLAVHAPGTRRVALGLIRAHAEYPLRLYERLQLDRLTRLASSDAAPRGADLYAGNVSFRRAHYLAVGGFDPALRLSEDAELGIRFEAAGIEFVVAARAVALHASDHASLANWMRRSVAYGEAEARVAEKHAGRRGASPWRFLGEVRAVSRPLLITAALAPAFARGLASAAAGVALLFARLSAERVAIAGMTLAYGLLYFAGVGVHAGSRRRVLSGLRRYLNGSATEELGFVGRAAKCVADVCADHEALHRVDAKYAGTVTRSGGWLVADAVQRIGFQMMVAYRGMRLLRDWRLPVLAKIASRVMRHLYAADIHWDAQLAPGVVIVHGTGLVISHAARVGPGCILFHHVTLGESMHAERREVGAPALGADVHVGPGATLLGPITLGDGTKVTANALLMDSVPPHSLVEAPAAVVRPRARGPRVQAGAGAAGLADGLTRRQHPRADVAR